MKGLDRYQLREWLVGKYQNEGNVVGMFVDTWVRLKRDRLHYVTKQQSSNKQKDKLPRNKSTNKINTTNQLI
jgi:hypothetical protein